jgi:sugar lactone lactonase YvrE
VHTCETRIIRAASFGTCLVISALAAELPARAEDIEWGEAAGNGRENTTTVRVQGGAPFHGTQGIDFGPDGLLYIASGLGNEIVAMNPDSGQVIDRVTQEVGVELPDDVAFGPDGSLYWTSFLKNTVEKRDLAAGVTSTVARLPGAGGADAIAFSEDGRLFVTECFLGDALYEVDPDGAFAPVLILNAFPPAFPLGCMNSMDFGPDGRLYGPLHLSALYTQFIPGLDGAIVVSVDVDNPADIQVVSDGYIEPAAAKFDSYGNLFVLDVRTGKIWRAAHVDESGITNVINEDYTTVTAGLDNFNIDGSDRMFVSSELDGFIVEILSTGTIRPVSPGGMILPGGVTVLPADGSKGDRVFVADGFSIREFNGSTGQEIHVVEATLVPGFPTPGTPSVNGTIAADDNDLIISGTFTNSVEVLQSDGHVIEHYEFNAPLNAIRFHGNLIVTELNGTGVAWEVVQFTPPDGPRVTIAGASLGHPIIVPNGLAATDNDLWVSDWATGIVWQLATNGISTLTPVATGLDRPEGLAVDIDGKLLVVEAGSNRLSKIDIETGGVTTIVDILGILNIPPPVGISPIIGFNGVAVGPSGDIYATGDDTNELYKISVRRGGH